MSNDKQFIDFKKEVEKLKEIDGAEEYAKQLAHLFLSNGLSLQTILLMAIDFGQQHPHWIPVEERLPKCNIVDCGLATYPVLVYREDGFKDISCYDSEVGEWDCVGVVTHWMPLPEAPRKEE